jgi:hypothetical protein
MSQIKRRKPRRPKFTPDSLDQIRDYFGFKLDQAQNAIDAVEPSVRTDPTGYSKATFDHWVKIRASILWLVHGLPSS